MSVLDAEELLHLGLHELKNNNAHGAIEHLKCCLEVDPGNAKATYLLGAVYAQIAMYDRAALFLEQAIALNPEEYTAVFQLGLLHLTSGRSEQARVVWQGVDALDEQHFLRLFVQGLLALARDDFARCVDLLERGMAANTENDALNNDMRLIKAAVEAAVAGGVEAEPGADVASHLVLSGYRQAQNR